jgi:hypothetical protein
MGQGAAGEPMNLRMLDGGEMLVQGREGRGGSHKFLKPSVPNHAKSKAARFRSAGCCCWRKSAQPRAVCDCLTADKVTSNNSGPGTDPNSSQSKAKRFIKNVQQNGDKRCASAYNSIDFGV